MNEFDITPYIVGVLGLFMMFLSTWLIPMIKSKTTVSQQQIIRAGANIVVYAAEQIFKGTGKGKEKLSYALDCLQEYLRSHGIKLDNYAIRPYIEAAVKALNLNQGESSSHEQGEDSGPVPGLQEWLKTDAGEIK